MAETSRSCGSCGACCKVYDVHEPFSKPAGVWCSHWSRAGGCDIYHDRPETCQKFKCSWIKGQGEDADRPDRVRIVMDSIPPFIEDAPDMVVRMAEVSVGGLKGDYARKMTAFFLERNFFVMQMALGGQRWMHIPRRRPVPQQAIDELIASGCEIVRQPGYF